MMMDKQFVREFHKQQVQDGHVNDENITAILNIIGGIDKIIFHYLSDWNNKLNIKQINQIHQIISTPLKYQQKNKITSLSKIHNNDPHKNEDKRPNFKYTFQESHNLLYATFNIQIAKLISDIMNNAMFKAVWFLSIIIHMIGISMYTNSKWHCLYVIFINILIWIPYMLFWILSVNKNAFRLILYRFEFWFKIIFAFIAQITALLDDFVLNIHDNKWRYPQLKLTTHIVISIDIILALIFVSLLDALHIKKSSKIFISSLVAIAFVFWSILLQIRSYSEIDHSVVNISSFMAFSVLSIRISAFRTVAIFTCKNAILHIIRAKYDRAVMIRCTPYIQWITDIDDKSEDKKLKINGNDTLKMDICLHLHTESTTSIRSDWDLNVTKYKKHNDINTDQKQSDINDKNNETDLKETDDTETIIIYSDDNDNDDNDPQIEDIEEHKTDDDEQLKYEFNDKDLSVITHQIASETLYCPQFQGTTPRNQETPANVTPITRFGRLLDANTYERESVSSINLASINNNLASNNNNINISNNNNMNISNKSYISTKSNKCKLNIYDQSTTKYNNNNADLIDIHSINSLVRNGKIAHNQLMSDYFSNRNIITDVVVDLYLNEEDEPNEEDEINDDNKIINGAIKCFQDV